MKTIDTSADNFKTSPLGFLMSVIAKYQAYSQKSFEKSGEVQDRRNGERAGEMLDNIKIELSRTEELQKEPSNEAVMIHVMEKCSARERQEILDMVFEYMNLLGQAMENIDKSTPEAGELMGEYYDVSRLGLVLNCYLGEFSSDDFFYGTLGFMCDAVSGQADVDSRLNKLCTMIVEKIQEAPIDLPFREFCAKTVESLDQDEAGLVYESVIRPYSEGLLEKVLTSEVDAEDVNRLACCKQVQRIWEGAM